MGKRVLALLLAGACAAGLLGCSRQDGAPQELPSGVAVQVKTVERRDVATED